MTDQLYFCDEYSSNVYVIHKGEQVSGPSCSRHDVVWANQMASLFNSGCVATDSMMHSAMLWQVCNVS